MADKKTRAQILGENLKRIRTEKNITRKQLAEKIGITEISFGKYERGESLAPLDKIFEIADFLQVSVASLTGENDFSNEVPNIEKTVEERIFNYRLQHAYKMASLYLDFEANKVPHFDDDGNIVIYSPKTKVYEGNGVFGYKGELDAIKFKTEDDFVKVMEQAEELALQRGLFFNLAFRNVIFNTSTYRVLDNEYANKPMI